MELLILFVPLREVAIDAEWIRMRAGLLHFPKHFERTLKSRGIPNIEHSAVVESTRFRRLTWRWTDSRARVLRQCCHDRGLSGIHIPQDCETRRLHDVGTYSTGRSIRQAASFCFHKPSRSRSPRNTRTQVLPFADSVIAFRVSQTSSIGSRLAGKSTATAAAPDFISRKAAAVTALNESSN